MSEVVYTVLVSPQSTAPWGDRSLAPCAVATLHIGGSAMWVVNRLGRGAVDKVEPAAPEFEGAALLVALAASVVGHPGVKQTLTSRASTWGRPIAIGAQDDTVLIAEAREAVAGRLRLSLAGDPIVKDRGSVDYLVESLAGIDIEFLIPVGVEHA